MSLRIACVICLLASVVRAENLLADPSFEETKAPDQYGIVFKNWTGWNWNYEAARFEVGTIARTGKTSYLLVGDPFCRISLGSRDLKLEPGRYRLQFHLRGQDIQRGEWKQPMTVALFGGGGTIDKVGRFGWTPVTLVRNLSEQQVKGSDKTIRLILKGGGRLWIDDISLEKVGEDVEVTPAPVVGTEETPFSPPQPAAAKTVVCQHCAYKVPADAATCYACGGVPSQAARDDSQPAVKLIADFEDGKKDPFRYGKIVSENAPQGTKALMIDETNTLIAGKFDWTQHDYFRFEVFNPEPEPVRMFLEISDRLSTGYWNRVNNYLLVPAGKSTISLRTDAYVGEKARPGRNLIRDAVTKLYFSCKTPVLIDNVRLERIDRPAIKTSALFAFDFGKLDSPVMEGYQQVTPAMVYKPECGFGFVKPRIWKSFNALQPDALFQDSIAIETGSFRVDVPSGKYKVWMNIDSATQFWGENQAWEKRKVTANGLVVVDEKQDFAAFMKKLFQNSRREVLPGIDTFGQCVQNMFAPKEFEVEATDGKIEIGFEGVNWSSCLSAMVIYPADSADGKAFLDWTAARRRAQFNEYFRQIESKKDPAPASGYALFTRHYMKAVETYDGPKAGEAIGAEGLSVTVAQGEEMPVTFALQPGAASGAELGAIDLKLSEFKNETGAGLAAGAIQPGWIDYRISRLLNDGSAYAVRPKYWHPTPAPAAPGVTRRFWLRVRTAADAVPGLYKGQVTVQPASGTPQSIPLAIRVLPLKLDEADVPVGPWGIWISPGNWASEEAKAWKWSMFEKSLATLRRDGWTSFSDVPMFVAKPAGGKVTFDFTAADKQMEAIRAAGFKHMVAQYSSGAKVGYAKYGSGTDADVAAATAAGFADMDSFLKAIWQAVDQHAKEKNWVPVAYNLCDEPIGPERIVRTTKTGLAHDRITAGLERTFFMGATSMKGSDAKSVKEHGDMVKALPIAVLNIHDEAAIKTIQVASHRFGYYNSAGRFTNGRYMFMLARKHNMTIRLNWHYNLAVGDPYFDLDTREEDFCWYNADENQNLIPRADYLGELITGLNDYRYLVTLERLVKEKASHPAAAAGKKVLDSVLALEAGKDAKQPWSQEGKDFTQVFDEQRAEVIEAIVKLLN